jgi:hypothetical protein
MPGGDRPLIPPSDFGKRVAEVHADIKADFERTLNPGGSRENLDRSVGEQVRGDIDKLIEKHKG